MRLFGNKLVSDYAGLLFLVTQNNLLVYITVNLVLKALKCIICYLAFYVISLTGRFSSVCVVSLMVLYKLDYYNCYYVF